LTDETICVVQRAIGLPANGMIGRGCCRRHSEERGDIGRSISRNGVVVGATILLAKRRTGRESGSGGRSSDGWMFSSKIDRTYLYL
jgi:hypothetical protein